MQDANFGLQLLTKQRESRYCLHLSMVRLAVPSHGGSEEHRRFIWKYCIRHFLPLPDADDHGPWGNWAKDQR